MYYMYRNIQYEVQYIRYLVRPFYNYPSSHDQKHPYLTPISPPKQTQVTPSVLTRLRLNNNITEAMCASDSG